MERGISIHIGVNRSASMSDAPLTECEDAAWRMSGIAFQAGYENVQLLRGPAATREAVCALLDRSTRGLLPGQMLFVSFSGHGSHTSNTRNKERQGRDETWCLHDADLVDDDLVAFWTQLPEGARVLVVDESCFSGGMGRPGESLADYVPRKEPVVYRSADPEVWRGVKQAWSPTESCVGDSPANHDGIRASVLMFTAASETQLAQEGQYTRRLLDVWDGGRFSGSFCDLHREVYQKVKLEVPIGQDPQIFMLGTRDPLFPEKRAFHLAEPVARDGGGLF